MTLSVDAREAKKVLRVVFYAGFFLVVNFSDKEHIDPPPPQMCRIIRVANLPQCDVLL